MHFSGLVAEALSRNRKTAALVRFEPEFRRGDRRGRGVNLVAVNGKLRFLVSCADPIDNPRPFNANQPIAGEFTIFCPHFYADIDFGRMRRILKVRKSPAERGLNRCQYDFSDTVAGKRQRLRPSFRLSHGTNCAADGQI